MQPPAEQTAPGSSVSAENRVQPIKFGHVNIYLIKTETGYILVDAGTPNKGKQLEKAFQNAGVDPKAIQLIIATHGHLDHVGSIAHAQRVSGGKILCHRSFADDLMKGKAEKPAPRNLLGRVLNLMTALMGDKFDGIKPDIVMEDEFDLTEYGIGGKIIHTPGHSSSSVSIMLDNGEALIGDMVRGASPDQIGLGMFYEDKHVLLENLEKVAAFEPRTIYLSHGATIDNYALRRSIQLHA